MTTLTQAIADYRAALKILAGPATRFTGEARGVVQDAEVASWDYPVICTACGKELSYTIRVTTAIAASWEGVPRGLCASCGGDT